VLLIHGDCLEKLQNITPGSVDLILTDPSYGTTACKWDSVIPFEPMWAQLKRIIKRNGAIVLFGSEPFSSMLRMSNIKNYRYDWIWDKKSSGSGLLAKIRPLKTTETLSIFSKKSPNYYPIMIKGKMRNKGSYGSKKDGVVGYLKATSSKYNDLYYPKNILNMSGTLQNGKLHPTQKPVALMEYLIKTYTLPGETVLDFTMGSGTTGVACVNLDREFIGIEKDPNYFKIAEKRINAAYMTKLDITCKTCTSGNPCPVKCPLTPIKRT
jgi:site-specific DNA-methyltransferase (adenine-specific)